MTGQEDTVATNTHIKRNNDQRKNDITMQLRESQMIKFIHHDIHQSGGNTLDLIIFTMINVLL